jgi:acyl dehydratase
VTVDHAAIRVGDEVPPLVRTITLPHMVAYAGATWDWHRLHYDPEYAAQKKLPAPIVDGQVFGALLVEQLQDWLGPRSFVHELSFTFRNLVFAGDTVRCEGTVTEVSPDRLTADLRVVVVDAEGNEDRVAAAPASAVVLLGRADGPGAP